MDMNSPEFLNDPHTRHAVDTVEQWMPRGQFTKITYRVVDTGDDRQQDEEIAIFPDGMRQEAYDLMDSLNNGEIDPPPFRDYTRQEYPPFRVNHHNNIVCDTCGEDTVVVVTLTNVYNSLAWDGETVNVITTKYADLSFNNRMECRSGEHHPSDDLKSAIQRRMTTHGVDFKGLTYNAAYEEKMENHTREEDFLVRFQDMDKPTNGNPTGEGTLIRGNNWVGVATIAQRLVETEPEKHPALAKAWETDWSTWVGTENWLEPMQIAGAYVTKLPIYHPDAPKAIAAPAFDPENVLTCPVCKGHIYEWEIIREYQQPVYPDTFSGYIGSIDLEQVPGADPEHIFSAFVCDTCTTEVTDDHREFMVERMS